jgi:hypothetical protein
MSTPKPRETYRNLIQLVSLRQAEKPHRNQRNHFLKEEANLVSPLARILPTPLCSQLRSAAAALPLRARSTTRKDRS